MTPEEIRNSIPDIKTSLDLLTLLNKVKRDIYGERCHPFSLQLLNYYSSPRRAKKAYAHFKIPKKSGGFREISAPAKSLKSILTCLNVVFQALYEPSKVAKGFLPGMSLVDNAKSHVGMPFVFNADLENFFPTVDQGRVWTVLQLPQYGFQKEIARMIAGLCCMAVEEGEPESDGGKRYRYILPQGAPTSPILTNMVCEKLDRRLQGIAKRFNLKCTRYADDITFSGKRNVFGKNGEFRAELEKVISGQGFRMNAKKTRLQKKGERQEVTGLTVCSKVNVSRQYIRDLQSILYIWERYGRAAAGARFALYYRTQKMSPVASAGSILERVIMGKLMYLKMVRGEEDSVFTRLYCRFIALCPSADGKRTGYRYDMALTVSDFERNYMAELNFKIKEESANGGNSVYAIARLDGRNEYVKVSRKCADEIKSAMAGGNPADMESLKSRFSMVPCEKSNGKSFWTVVMPVRRRTGNIPLQLHTGEHPEVQMETHAGGKSGSESVGFTGNLDELLSEFVDSGFNYMILDKWEEDRISKI